MSDAAYVHTVADAFRVHRPQAGRPGKVLDFGCGTGHQVLAFLEAGYDCVGCDITGPSIDQAHRVLADAGHDPARIHHLDVPLEVHEVRGEYRLPFDDDAFDLVLSESCLEHVSDLETVAAELARVVKPDGVIVADLPPLTVLVEPHTHVPLLQFLPRGGPRRAWTRLWFALGFHKHPESTPADVDHYFDHGIFYRSDRELHRILGRHFDVHDDGYRWYRRRMRNRGIGGLGAFFADRASRRAGTTPPLDETDGPVGPGLALLLRLWSWFADRFYLKRLVLLPARSPDGNPRT